MLCEPLEDWNSFTAGRVHAVLSDRFIKKKVVGKNIFSADDRWIVGAVSYRTSESYCTRETVISDQSRKHAIHLAMAFTADHARVERRVAVGPAPYIYMRTPQT